ncbi:MAG TPA: rhodanese-like domain-containing protein [Arenibaculum sp.]|nr:rhodanese-like domain-containing protein [Arenibaculum sp.]
MDMDRLLVAALIAAAAILAWRLVRGLVSPVRFVMPAELKAKLDRGDDLAVLDVRTPGEFTGGDGHIAGAVNVPLSELDGRLGELGARIGEHDGTEIVVVCRSGARAATAARRLRKAGLRDVGVLRGGMLLWRGTGLPTEPGVSGRS